MRIYAFIHACLYVSTELQQCMILATSPVLFLSPQSIHSCMQASSRKEHRNSKSVTFMFARAPTVPFPITSLSQMCKASGVQKGMLLKGKLNRSRSPAVFFPQGLLKGSCSPCFCTLHYSIIDIDTLAAQRSTQMRRKTKK